jgi:hypothetical protein
VVLNLDEGVSTEQLAALASEVEADFARLVRLP